MLTKSESKILKGTAILIMLWLHLFNNQAKAAGLSNLIVIDGVPLVYLLSKFATICVGFYLFLGGYGLYVSRGEGVNSKKSRQRVLLLFANFWVVFGIFVGLGSWIKPAQYPGSIPEFIQNFTAWNTSYNGEWWFLFPYAIIILFSKYLFDWLEKQKTGWVLLLSGVIYLITIVLISRFGDAYLYHNQLLYMPVLVLSLLFPFLLGALCARVDWVGKSRIYLSDVKWKQLLLSAALLLLVIITVLSPVQAPINPFIVVGFVLIFANLTRPKFIDKILSGLGNESTNMWLIHTFFCYYLFSDFIYGFKFPLLIYVVLIGCSYLSARLITLIYKPVSVKLNKVFDKN